MFAGRIMADDEDDYDSEMDDFIDDGPQDDYSNDYSKYISEIFGYDKSKYRYADDDVDNMETSFAQQMREEVISTKIGMQIHSVLMIMFIKHYCFRYNGRFRRYENGRRRKEKKNIDEKEEETII